MSKKNPILNRVKIPARNQPAEPLEIKTQAGIHSPHVLNLQNNAPERRGTSPRPTAPAQSSDVLAELFSSQRQEWSKTTESFFSRATAWGAEVQKRLNERASFRKRLVRRGFKFQSIYAPFHITRYTLHATRSHLAHFILLLIAITIPIQAIFVYQTINAKQTALKRHWQSALGHANVLAQNALAGDFMAAQNELEAALKDVGELKQMTARLGPLTAFLPDRFEQAIALLAKTEKTGQDALTISSYLSGRETPRRILLIFQNPRELRPTGGFAGSFALLTVKDGAITNVEVPEGGTYAVQGQLALRRIAPKPLRLINPRFEFQDANWWPDFPTSAAKMTELFEAAGGPTVDAVVALTADVGSQILALAGPLATEEGTLETENFIDVLQETIARDRASDRRSPKKIIAALFNPMRAAVAQAASQKPKQSLELLSAALGRKDIQLWARDEQVQAALRRFGVIGEMARTDGDYVSVVFSNVGGGKTDRVVSTEFNHEVQVRPDGFAEVALIIKRAHNGQRGDQIQGLRNVSYVRVYVPQGSRLISAAGFTPLPDYLFEHPDATLEPDPYVRESEISRTIDAQSRTEIWNETDKTVFGNWIMADPGATAEATLRYVVPLAPKDRLVPYRLTIEPQAGSRALLQSRVSAGPGLGFLHGTRADGTWGADGWNYAGLLDKTITTASILYRL